MTVSSIGDAVIVADAIGRVTFVNSVGEELIGRTVADARGRPLTEVFPIFNEHTGEVLQGALANLPVTPPSTQNIKRACLRRADGTSEVVDVSSAPMQQADGTSYGIVLIFRTAAPHAAEQGFHENHGGDEFFSALAHELRNPLAPIRNALQIMQVVEDDGATSSAARTIIERQLKHITSLIDDLLDMSRIAHGKFELTRERGSLGDVIKLALKIARPQLEGKQHPLQVELPPESLYVAADLKRLAQVFANLLRNASKYSSAGTPIRLAVSGEPNEVVVRVGDQGIGIPADMFERVFDPYAQVDRIEDGTHDGLGIGLTLVKRIVELHGGSVTATSAGLGRGSEFTVRLPRDTSDGAAGQPPAAFAPQAPSSGLRILVADDNRDAAHTLAMLLRLDGHDVRAVHDGIEALTTGDDFKPQLVLLDLGMPLLDGYETARQIQERPWGKKAHLVALTGWGDEADRRKTKAAGFQDHLVKPAEPEAIKAVIDGIDAD
jgi:PAS domain S-box-containing protein